MFDTRRRPIQGLQEWLHRQPAIFAMASANRVRIVPIYRFYVIAEDGHIAAPPTVVDCADDDSAVEKANQYLDGEAIEVWELRRLVTRLEPAHK